jgi:hypothetical protein
MCPSTASKEERMSRRRQDEAVAKRRHQILTEKASRRGRRRAAEAEAPRQAVPNRPKREKPPRKERKPRVHQDLLTVAYRGPLANRFRQMADRYQMTLSGLLQDALLHYEGQVTSGHQLGTALAAWKAQRGQEATGA